MSSTERPSLSPTRVVPSRAVDAVAAVPLPLPLMLPGCTSWAMLMTVTLPLTLLLLLLLLPFQPMRTSVMLAWGGQPERQREAGRPALDRPVRLSHWDEKDGMAWTSSGDGDHDHLAGINHADDDGTTPVPAAQIGNPWLAASSSSSSSSLSNGHTRGWQPEDMATSSVASSSSSTLKADLLSATPLVDSPVAVAAVGVGVGVAGSGSAHRRYRSAENGISAHARNGLLNDDDDDDDDTIVSTRPSLQRLTSNSLGSLLYGLDRLHLRSGSTGTGTSANASTESVSTQDAANDGVRRSLDEIRRISKGKARMASSSQGLGQDNDVLGQYGLTGGPDGHREAFLHVVEKGDSLMGIALLYGCTVSSPLELPVCTLAIARAAPLMYHPHVRSQAQAIRTANKLWLNDPIMLRKTLFIPLDACTQPPSKDVEFVQRAGEDAIHLYFRSAAAGTTVSSPGRVAVPPAHHRTRQKHHRDSSLRNSLSDSANEHSDGDSLLALGRPLTPYHDATPNDERSSSPFFSHSDYLTSTSRQPASGGAPLEAYLASTNPEYTSQAGLPHAASSKSSSHRASPSSPTAALPLAREPVPLPSLPGLTTKKRTVQIGSMSTGAVQARARAPTPRVSVEAVTDTGASQSIADCKPAGDARLAARGVPSAKGQTAAVSVFSSSLLTPSSSSDGLAGFLHPGAAAAAAAVGSSGTAPNLRLRPRSPFEGADAGSASRPPSQLPIVGAAASSSSDAQRPSRRPIPGRARKISKEAVPRAPTSAAASGPDRSGAGADYALQPARAVNYLANAGAGLFSSLMSASGTGSGTRAGARTAQADRAGGSGGGGSKWFAMDDFEDEIQLARRYQAQAQRRALPGAGSGKTSSETRRSRSLME